jgi:2,4-dienoyl-CoA reductase-like NADH-dependent reductase (Old Yellow Enzyme family)
MIDRRALGEPGNVVIEDESDLPSLKQWAEAATNEGVLDAVGIARLMAIDPDAPAALLSGRDSNQEVRPISTGIKPIDRMGLMEILWYTRQLKRIAQGKNPNPNESGLWAFLSSVVNSGWGTYRTQRLRA